MHFDVRPLGRIGVLGDVHTHADRVERALEALREMGVDRILCCGDLTDGPGDLDRCVALLQEHDVLTVAGNHERWALAGTMRDLPHATLELTPATREWITALPPTARIATTNGGALVCHAVAEDDMFFLNEDTRGYALQPVMPILRRLMLDPETTYMIAAHTHRRMVRRFQGLVVVNAGTLHDDGPPGFVVVDFDAKQVLPYDLAQGPVVAAEPIVLPDPAPLPR
ncbi:MAG: metallophosphoesterase [Sandaracinus sp.]|nr:metallophosphoesterase [Sandaracinus sp.]